MAWSSSPTWFARWLLFVLVVLCLCCCVWSYSTLKVSLPSALVTETNQATGSNDAHIPEYSALFGQPDYGTSITNSIFMSNVANGCNTISAKDSGAKENPNTGGYEPFFLLIDRGNCTFVTKVLNAQNAGAVGVVMANIEAPAGGAYGYGDTLVYMADDNLHGKQVTIPSQLIPLSHGTRLKRYISAGAVVLSMAFQTPAPDNRTEWELWTSAYADGNDIMTFYSTFGTVVDTLKDRALFTPHYTTFTRSGVNCGSDPNCNSQCTASGVCYVQPSGLSTSVITGAQIIVESVRQLCVYNSELSSGSLTVGHYWFQYVQQFQTECQRASPMKFTDACANSVLSTMAAADSAFNQVNRPLISTCIENNPVTGSGAVPQILQWEQTNQTIRWNNFTPFLPSLFINNDMFTGTVVCAKLSPSSCSIVDDICNGYAPGTVPPACFVDCPFGTPFDCSNTCNGVSVIDSCGICISPNSTNWNSCLDCSGVPHGGKVRDSCEVCGGDGSSCSSSVSLTGIIVGVVLGSVAIFAIVAFFIQRKRNRMKADVNVLLQQYVPLADNFNVGPASGHTNSTGRSAFPSRNSDPDRASLVAGSASTSEEDL